MGANSLKLVNPMKLKQSLITSFHSSPSSSSSYSLLSRTQSLNGKLKVITTWIKHLQPKLLHYKFSKFMYSHHPPHLHFSGSVLCYGGLIGVSFMEYYQEVAYAMDGGDVLVDDRDYSSDGSVNVGKYVPMIWIFVRKLWLPVFFFLTVLVNWDHPVLLCTKVAIFLFSTKPTPLSVYVFVDQLCRQFMRDKPYLYLLKSLYANKVEVQDYKLFCLATVEVKDQKLTLLGVLGGWWALPLSQRTFSVFWESVLY